MGLGGGSPTPKNEGGKRGGRRGASGGGEERGEKRGWWWWRREEGGAVAAVKGGRDKTLKCSHLEREAPTQESLVKVFRGYSFKLSNTYTKSTNTT